MHVTLVVVDQDDHYARIARLALRSAGVTIEAELRLTDDADAGPAPVDLVVVATARPAEQVAALRHLARSQPVPVVVLAPRANFTSVAEAMACGAHGYLLSTMEPAELTGALAHAAAGDIVLPRAIVAGLAREMRSGASPLTLAADSPLTPRERIVLTMLREGSTTRQIAERLGVEVVTVRSHISAIVHKCGVSNRSALIDERSDNSVEV